MIEASTVVAPRHQAAAAADLPRWNLDDLYRAPDAPEIERDLDWAHRQSDAFRARYDGRLAALDGRGLGEAIAAYEAIVERLHKVMTYAQLVFAGDMADPENGRFLQTIRERYTDITTITLFFTLELNRLDEAVVEAQLADPGAARYRPWLRDLRAFRPHQLADDLEALFHEKRVTGAGAWVRLFDRTLADARFRTDAGDLTLSETLNLLDHADEDVRRDGARALGAGLAERVELFALIANTLAKDKEIEDKWRRYPRPVSARNLSNMVEDEVVEALVGSIRGAYGELSHRYYRLKARWFGGDTLAYWNRNAPLPAAEERRYGWPEARRIVLGAFARFDARLADIAGRFFEHGWIDAPPRPGKDPGAFCHPAVPSCHPYVLLNFYGRPRDITTLAHELGHGVHQVLAAHQGELMADTPLTLAETASVFGEMLVFRALLDDEDDPDRRRRLLARKVEDMLNTVVRQTAFFEFERRVHDERRRRELSTERFGELWMEVQRESLGPALRFDDGYRHFWAYIPHFIHSPFYVYAYAFGDCLVNALYRVYRDGHPGFEDRFVDMLGAGGTRRHRELLRPFGLDASDPGFWRRGLDVVGGLIDELEALG